MRHALIRKRCWRKHYHQLLDSLPWENCATFPFPRDQHKQESHSLFYSPSQTARKFLTTIAREIGASLSHAAAIIAVVFVCIFLIGAESSFETSIFSIVPRNYYSTRTNLVFSRPSAFSPIENHLHEHHTIPVRYIRLLSPEYQTGLLSLLSTPASRSHLSPSVRRAVFTHITDCSISQCLRAMTSSIAYARTTGRVAVIFADKSGRNSVVNVVQQGSGGVLNGDAMLIGLEQSDVKKMTSDLSTLSDWAEFSVIEAVVPGRLRGNASGPTSSSNRAISPLLRDPKFNRDQLSETTSDLPVIGNTKTVATLDNLAVVDVHVALALSEVVWSKFSPRTVQEYILSSDLEPTSDYAQDAISGASILGRHPETRSIANAEEILQTTFEVPFMLLRGMSPLAKKLLLLKLMSKKRKGVKTPRAFFLHAQYGLGNRLRALGSAMAFARQTDRVLVLTWVPDQHLNCKYTDLFVNNDEFVISDAFLDDEEWPFKNSAVKDPKMKSVKWYSYMRINGKPTHTPKEPVIDDPSYHIYVSTCYVIQSPVTPFIIRTQSSYWQVLRTLTPHIDVMRLIERFASYPMSSMVGVHIRGKSIKADIAGISAADYSEESSRRTDYWRNLTQVDSFVAEMKRQPPDQLFYIAADQRQVLLRLEREFPSRVFYTPRSCDGRDKECLPFALADILLLARCASLRGSYWSSFSELSVRIGGARFLLAGIDFGRP